MKKTNKKLARENAELKTENIYLAQKLMQTEEELLRLRNWLKRGAELTIEYKPKHAREYRED